MYHRQGFDQMSENVQKGRSAVFEALKLTQKVHKAEPNSFNTRLFYTAKNDEIIKLFTKAEASEKNELITLLETVDPANANKYGGINDGGR